MNAYEKIRAALEQATGGRPSNIAAAQAALAALAELELEKAVAEPVATVCLITDRFAHNHCIEAQLQVAPDAQLPIGTKLYTAPPPAPIAEMTEPTPEECIAINEHALRAHGIEGCGAVFNGRVLFDAVKDVMWPKSEGL